MKTTLALLFILLPALVRSQDNAAPHYKIYNTKSEKLISVDDIVNDLDTTDVVFFGEEHNDSTGHQLELMLLSSLNEKNAGKTALSMEMFETDCQTVLNEYLAGLIREKNFIKDARVWPNYKDYRPLVEYAKANNVPVIAANAPERYTNMVNRLGLKSLEQLDKTGRLYLPPRIDTATGAYLQKFDNIMGGHGSMPGMQMYQAQNVWDATMGWSIARFFKEHRGYKIMQINGGFHSEEKLGAAAQLKRYDHKIRVKNIAVYSDDSFDKPDWSKFKNMADYVILTDPKLPRSF
jgi:uncharacterized iron-regulated protein